MQKLILFRHGLTEDNLRKRYSGFRDTALHKNAGAQLRKIKDKLKTIPIDIAYCSDLARCRQSAKIVFGERYCPIVRRRGLREIDFGAWDGLTYKDVLRRYNSLYRRWLKDPFRVNIPSGEKMRGFAWRIRKELKNIISANQGRTVALVAHLGVMRIILNIFMKIKPEDFWKLRLGPGRIYIIEPDAGTKAKIQKI